MRIIVVHSSPDLDAITSAWLIKRFLPGWEDVLVRFVPAGERYKNSEFKIQSSELNPIENIGEDEVIHADTGLGPLDHHQTADTNVCAASLTLDYIKRIQNSKFKIQNSKRVNDRMEAVSRIVRVVVDVDHFKEVFWKDSTSDYHEFSLVGILDGLKIQKPDQDEYYVDFVVQCLDAILHEFENRIWAEREIAEKGKKFKTRFGRGIGFETINDTVIKLSQKMGYVIVVRKDPRKGYVRIKATPLKLKVKSEKLKVQYADIDLTLAYEKLKKMDPDATWFLHVGRKMLLNGSVKNPKMRPTKLSLSDIIKVLEKN